MMLLLLGLGLLLVALGAGGGAAVVAAGQVEATRQASRRLRGVEPVPAWLDDAERLLVAASALSALGVALAGAGAAGLLYGLAPVVVVPLLVLVGVPLVLGLGHLLPRWVALRGGGRAADALVPLLRPVARLFGLLLPTPRSEPGALLAEVWHEALTTGVRPTEELAVAGGVLAFAGRTVRDVMTPRTEVVAVSEEASLHEITETFAQSGYSRLPVYRGTLDEIVGMLHAFDLFRLRPGDPLPVRPVSATPASRSAADALLDMQRERRHLAVALDEFGGTLGIVSLEDLLEELVGDIFDEHDEVTPLPTEEGGLLEADGGTPLEALEERFGRRLPGVRATTVAGVLAEVAGRIPVAGERFLLGGLEFDVLEASPARVERVVVRPGPVPFQSLTPEGE